MGLIACHHQSTKYVRRYVLFMSFCQVASLEFTSKEYNEDLDYKIKVNSIKIYWIYSWKEFLAGLVKSKSNLLDLVGAQGVAVYFDNNVFVIGKTPEQADIQDLIEWLESKTYNDVFILIPYQKFTGSREI